MKYSDKLSRRVSALSFHSGIQAILSYLFIANWTLWTIPLIIFISHFLIDFIKTWYKRNTLPAFLIDQAAHYAVLTALWICICHNSSILQTESFIPTYVWGILMTYIAVLAPTSILIKLFMEYERWVPDEPSLKGLPNAGKWIGFLERILILTFIYTGSIEGIGFLLAAKSVFRFGELNRTKDIKVTEYVLIGTFLSFTVAILLGFGMCRILNLP